MREVSFNIDSNIYRLSINLLIIKNWDRRGKAPDRVLGR